MNVSRSKGNGAERGTRRSLLAKDGTLDNGTRRRVRRSILSESNEEEDLELGKRDTPFAEGRRGARKENLGITNANADGHPDFGEDGFSLAPNGLFPCTRKCNCYLEETMQSLQKKLSAQAELLDDLENSEDEVRCCVELTESERELFGDSIKDDTTVCKILIRELGTQKRDLGEMMDQWVEFVEKIERFSLAADDIKSKLVNLGPMLESIADRMKMLELSESDDYETRQRELEEMSKRAEERWSKLEEHLGEKFYVLKRYLEAEDRDRRSRVERQCQIAEIDKDHLTDREAVKLALKKMILCMGGSSTGASADRLKPEPPELEKPVVTEDRTISGPSWVAVPVTNACIPEKIPRQFTCRR